MSGDTETKEDGPGGEGALPMKARGCPWRFWSGIVGISDRLVVFDGALPLGTTKELSPRARRVLAARMIELWQRFGAGEE